MAALHCTVCNIDWPPQRYSFAKCPNCDEPTSYISDATPVSHTEAQKLQTSPARQAYDTYWADEPKRTPPADPCEEHHQGYERWPAYERLCDQARSQGTVVHLVASRNLALKEAGKERRNIEEIALLADGWEIAAELIREEDFDLAAASLFPALGEQVESD